MHRGGPELAEGGLPWPKGTQALMVRAAIGPQHEVEQCFRAWRRLVNIDDHMDGGTYRLLPLVYERLRAAGSNDPLMGRLKGVYRRAWVETQSVFHAVAPVVARLEAAGVRTLLLKGAPLALTYYKSHGTRPMFDLDVVVARDQRDLALEVVQSAGWRPGVAVRPHEMVDQHAIDLRNADGREMDLHWHCLREAPSSAADDWFWRRALPFDFCGVQTLQPDPTAMVLHAVVHGVRSNLEPPIRWIVDASTVIRAAGEDIDWNALIAFATAQKLRHRLSLGLDYMASEYAVPVPEAVLAELRGSRPTLVERVENVVYLGSAATMYRPRLYPLIDYWRHLRNQSPWAFARGYGAYLARRWQLDRPLQVPAEAISTLHRHLTRRRRETPE